MPDPSCCNRINTGQAQTICEAKRNDTGPMFSCALVPWLSCTPGIGSRSGTTLNHGTKTELNRIDEAALLVRTALTNTLSNYEIQIRLCTNTPFSVMRKCALCPAYSPRAGLSIAGPNSKDSQPKLSDVTKCLYKSIYTYNFGSLKMQNWVVFILNL